MSKNSFVLDIMSLNNNPIFFPLSKKCMSQTPALLLGLAISHPHARAQHIPSTYLPGPGGDAQL